VWGADLVNLSLLLRHDFTEGFTPEWRTRKRNSGGASD
jgi:hypothetical protein